MELPIQRNDRVTCSRCHKMIAKRLPDGRIEVKGWGSDMVVTADPPVGIVCPRCQELNDIHK